MGGGGILEFCLPRILNMTPNVLVGKSSIAELYYPWPGTFQIILGTRCPWKDGVYLQNLKGFFYALNVVNVLIHFNFNLSFILNY